MASIAARAADASGARDYSFAAKIVLAAALVALADHFFFLHRAGTTIGLFAAALLAALLTASPAVRRNRASVAAAAAAGLFALALADDPSLLAWTLFWIAAASAALLPRAVFDHGGRWALRLAGHGIVSAIGPVLDLARLRKARRHLRPRAGESRAALLALPVLGGLVFLGLFAAANPLIGRALTGVDLAAVVGGFSILRLLLWIVAALVAWSLLRPHPIPLDRRAETDSASALPGVNLASVTLSLIVFNFLFALQNALDLVFLWSGAPLPEGVTLAEYAHRGAYPLVATALLAGLFVLVTLRPGSDTSASPRVRRLVYLWIGQNVLLLASTAIRTLEYVEAYSLTRLRIAALLWMGLIAVGLVLICWRIAREKSGAWLVNTNLAAAAIVLAGCAFVDLGAAAAHWNVRHGREAGGRGAAIDLCYLHRLGSSALLPLIELESRPHPPRFVARVAWVRNTITDRLETDQADWRGWTFRNHRRLERARILASERRLPRASGGFRECDGRPIATQPLTAERPG